MGKKITLESNGPIIRGLGRQVRVERSQEGETEVYEMPEGEGPAVPAVFVKHLIRSGRNIIINGPVTSDVDTSGSGQ